MSTSHSHSPGTWNPLRVPDLPKPQPDLRKRKITSRHQDICIASMDSMKVKGGATGWRFNGRDPHEVWEVPVHSPEGQQQPFTKARKYAFRGGEGKVCISLPPRIKRDRLARPSGPLQWWSWMQHIQVNQALEVNQG